MSDDRTVESLLRLAGPREPVPADRLNRLRAAAHADWQVHVRARRRRVAVAWSLGGVAAAAVVGLVVLQTPDVGPPAGSAAIAATIESLGGDVTLSGTLDGASPARLRVGESVPVGRDASTTAGSYAALRLPSGATLRMDEDSALHLEASDAVVLTKGAVYINAGGPASLEVRTRFGNVRDVGTKFEVRLMPSGVRVRVREGAVQVGRDGRVHDARAGDELALDAAGAATRQAIPASDDVWAWTTAPGPVFKIEGRSLREFLDWVARENRWELRFADVAVEEKANTTTLHGSIQGLSAQQALSAVVPVSGLEHRLDRRVLSIRRAARGKD